MLDWLKQLFCKHTYLWTGDHLYYLGEGTKTVYRCPKCGKEKQVWIAKAEWE